MRLKSPFPGVLVLAFFGLSGILFSGVRRDEPDLATGVRQVNDGDFEGALLTLDSLARDLSGQASRAKELAQVYLFLGVAYVGLGQETLAKAKFQQALALDKHLTLSPDEFSAKVIRSFESARHAMSEEQALEKEARKKSGKGALILLGVGGAGAAGLAVALAGERSNTPPSASLTISPEGQAVVDATRLTFTASASDPEGEPLRYHWSFGDAESAEGPSATHVYRREGTFTVTLTVRDGLSATTATRAVTARTLTGRWAFTAGPVFKVSEYQLQQGTDGSVILLSVVGGGGKTFTCQGGGRVEDPRLFTAGYNNCSARAIDICVFFLRGEADPSLQTITGFLEKSGPFPCNTSSSIDVTLTRK